MVPFFKLIDNSRIADAKIKENNPYIKQSSRPAHARTGGFFIPPIQEYPWLATGMNPALFQKGGVSGAEKSSM